MTLQQFTFNLLLLGLCTFLIFIIGSSCLWMLSGLFKEICGWIEIFSEHKLRMKRIKHWGKDD